MYMEEHHASSPGTEEAYVRASTPDAVAAGGSGRSSSGGNSSGGGELRHRSAGDLQRRAPSRQVSSIDLPKVKTGIPGASSNLVNSIVGAGIIGIPYAIQTSGLVMGVFLLVLVGIFTDKSLRMIVEVARFHPILHDLHVVTFEDVMTIPFGKAGRYFILASMFVLAYGAMVAYMLIVKDNVPTVLGLGDSFMDREFVMFVFSLLIMLPLSMLRDISQLAFTSSLSVLADVILVIIVCIFAPVKESVSNAGGLGKILEENSFNHQLFIGLGILSTAMACQHSAFLISGSLNDTNPTRWSSVTCISVGIATFLCIVLGVVGYLGYLTETQGDVLNNFPQATPSVDAARLLLAITMFLTYPMESFVARHVLMQLLFNGNMDNTTVGPNGEQIPETKFCGVLGRREKWTIYLYLVTLIPALLVNDLGPVLSLTGSLGASSIAYIAPGLVYLGVNGTEFIEWTNKMLSDRGYKTQQNKLKQARTTGDVELPVVGDAGARMQTTPDSSIDSMSGGGKPIWWWLFGFPIWTAVAAQGAHNSTQFLIDLHEGDPIPEPTSKDENEHITAACPRDFIWSMVFIVFGVIAAVFGVVSNIYVQVNKAFFAP